MKRNTDQITNLLLDEKMARSQNTTKCEGPLFVLTIDTEEEWDWSAELPQAPFSTKNIKQIPEFQKFCKDLSIQPTYFVDYAVLEKQENADLLKHYFDLNECDIGAHLHPWANPPIREEICNKNSHAINLDLNLFEEKLDLLTQKIVDTFKTHPYSYRAGRWGINADQLKILANLGYRVDSSVRPFYTDAYFSYDQAKTTPYWPSMNDMLLADDSQRDILEVPVTSGFDRKNFEFWAAIQTALSKHPINKARLIGAFWHLGIVRKITVTPEGHKSRDIQRCIDKSILRDDRVINMFFHSSDLLPGCTEYVRSNEEKTSFLDCIFECVEYVRDKHNGTFTTMREIRYQLTGSR